MTPPPVSIGMPVYNGARHLPAALDSILGQSFGDFELVLCDNASTDATGEICRAYAARDPRIRYHRQPSNLGAARNYNDAFHRSTGHYFKWAAHDDMIAPDFLERCVARLEAEPGAAVAFARMREIDDEGRVLGDHVPQAPWCGRTPATRIESLLLADDPYQSLINRCVPITGLFRREVLARTRLIGAFPHADKVTLVEVALRGDFAKVAEPLFLRRIHPGVSQAANPSPRALAQWFDPKAGRGLVLPRTRLLFEYARSVARADIPWRDRTACARILLRLFRRDWRVPDREIRRALRAMLKPSS